MLTPAAFVACGLVAVKGMTRSRWAPPFSPALSRQDHKAEAPLRRAVRRSRDRVGHPGQATGATQATAAALRRAELSADDVTLLRRTIETKYQGLGRFNFYQLLDLPSAATQKEIHYSYTYGQVFYHPDLAKRKEFADLKPKLEAIFARLEEAYYTLVDVEKRKKYDRGHSY